MYMAFFGTYTKFSMHEHISACKRSIFEHIQKRLSLWAGIFQFKSHLFINWKSFTNEKPIRASITFILFTVSSNHIYSLTENRLPTKNLLSELVLHLFCLQTESVDWWKKNPLNDGSSDLIYSPAPLQVCTNVHCDKNEASNTWRNKQYMVTEVLYVNPYITHT